LSKDEIEKMRRDADAHADEDKEKREEIEVRNEADGAVYRSDKLFKDTWVSFPKATGYKLRKPPKKPRMP